MSASLPIPARLVFRLSITVTLSLVVAYALNLSSPYLVPVLAFIFNAPPGPPIGPKKLFSLVLVLSATLGIGLLAIPGLLYMQAFTLICILLGLFVSNMIALKKGNALMGTFLTIGLTMITAVGYQSFPAALDMFQTLLIGLIIVVITQWIFFPLFPVAKKPAPPPKKTSPKMDAVWLAARTTIIVFPPFLLALCNSSLFLALVIKSTSIGQQGTRTEAANTAKELVYSTLVGGALALFLWAGLLIHTNLWMFALWTLLIFLYIAGKFYRVSFSTYSAPFWKGVATTTLILMGAAVDDSKNGDPVWQEFAIRLTLFTLIALYSYAAIHTLDFFRNLSCCAGPPNEANRS